MCKAAENIGDPHWSAVNVKTLNKNILSSTNSMFDLVGAVAKRLDISDAAAKAIIESNTAFDAFKNYLKAENANTNIDLTNFKQTIDNVMQNAKSPSQVINQEIDKPSHYSSKSGKDVIDWCEDFGIMENAYVFNIFKYLCRAGKKNNNSELQDALKARIYLDRYIERLQRQGK